ncbi:hypothetical protein CR513_37178, partial [Mucuna pruriens]
MQGLKNLESETEPADKCNYFSNGWTNKKRRSIFNLLVNSPKGTIFLYSIDTYDISKTTENFFKRLVDNGWQRRLDPEYNVLHALHTLLFKADWAESLSYALEGLVAP